MFTDEYEQEQHEKEFGLGEQEGEEGGFWDDAFQELEDIIGIVVPGETSEHRSRRAGYERGRRNRTGW